MCTARDGKWAGRKICLEEKYRCDNFVQCTEAEDEYNCKARYFEKGIFSKNDRYVCKSPSVPLKTKKNTTGKYGWAMFTFLIYAMFFVKRRFPIREAPI